MKYNQLIVCLSSGESIFSSPDNRVEKRLKFGKRERWLLRALVAHANVTLSRTELVRTVWPGRVISENTLSVNIYRLRSKLRCVGRSGDICVQIDAGYVFRSIDEKKDVCGAEQIVIYGSVDAGE